MPMFTLEEHRNFWRAIDWSDPKLRLDLRRVMPPCSAVDDTEDNSDSTGKMALAIASALVGPEQVVKEIVRLHRDGNELHVVMRENRDGIVDQFVAEAIARGLSVATGGNYQSYKSVHPHRIDKPGVSFERAWKARRFDAPLGVDIFTNFARVPA